MPRTPKTRNSASAHERRHQRIVRHPDSVMLDFVGLHVQEINTVIAKRGVRVEVIYYPDEDDMQIVTRIGKTEIEAFRQCIKDVMPRMPNDQALPR